MADQYYERAFQAKMREAMKKVKLILHTEKNPESAADCHHQYQDNYCNGNDTNNDNNNNNNEAYVHSL